MITIHFICGYCGNRFKDSSWTLSNISKTCPICKEKKNVKGYKSRDVFGYDEKEVVELEEQLKFGDD